MSDHLHEKGEQISVKQVQLIHTEVPSCKKHIFVFLPMNFKICGYFSIITTLKELQVALKN